MERGELPMLGCYRENSKGLLRETPAEGGIFPAKVRFILLQEMKIKSFQGGGACNPPSPILKEKKDPVLPKK